jgi:hypothetical protein
MVRSPCTMLVALDLRDLPPRPTISPALDNVARQTTPFEHPLDKNSKAPAADES